MVRRFKRWYLRNDADGKLMTVQLSDLGASVAFTDNLEIAYSWDSETELIAWEDKHQNLFNEYCTPVEL